MSFSKLALFQRSGYFFSVNQHVTGVLVCIQVRRTILIKNLNNICENF